MHTIIHPLKSASRNRSAETSRHGAFRKPHYDCVDQSDALQLVIYIPGVEAAGVEIITRGPDLTVVARKAHVVRVNWQALHLEGAQRDYQLCLRLGTGLRYEALQAELASGVLTITLPKKHPNVAPRSSRVA